jgi:rod shape-determining protein MreD
MKVFLLFLAVGFILVLLQTTLLHQLHLGPFVPDLTLVLCVYLGLHHHTVGAVVGSFMLGYSVDVFSSRELGINCFAMSLVFLTVYLSSRFVWVNNPLLSAPVVFVASWVKLASLTIVWTLFLTMDGLGIGGLKYAFLDALLAAVLAPAMFSLLRRSQSYIESKQASVEGS